MENVITQLIDSHLGLSIADAENSSEILINAFDADHKVLFWNKKAEEYFGIDKESALGMKLEELVPATASNSKMQYLQKALAGTSVYISRAKYERRPAEYQQWLLPVKKDGKVVAALNIVKDVETLMDT